jgi:hypothetical protein
LRPRNHFSCTFVSSSLSSTLEKKMSDGETPYERAWYRLRMGYEPREVAADVIEKFPVCLYEGGQLVRGRRVFSCIRNGCGLLFQPTDVLPVHCTHCGRGPLKFEDLDRDTQSLLKLLEQMDPEAIKALEQVLAVAVGENPLAPMDEPPGQPPAPTPPPPPPNTI